MKVFFQAALAASTVAVVAAGVNEKCTFPSRGDSADPTCVWDDYASIWAPAFTGSRCCLNAVADNAACDYDNEPISEAMCAAINASNANCTATGGPYFMPGFTSTDWACDDFAPDCLETLTCDTDNGYEGTPWIMCNADGGEFEMFGCRRGAADPTSPNEVYLPYKYMNVDLTSGNKKTSLDSAVESCDETNCAAIVAGNGACNPLGECHSVSSYWIHQDADYTDLYPDTSTDLYVNPFRWIGPPERIEVPAVTDQTDPDSIRFSDLAFYTPMFDCMAGARGLPRYRDESFLEIDQTQSGTGMVLDNFRFTQSILDYIVNDLGVDESLLTQDPGEAKTSWDGVTADASGTSQYFGRIETVNGTLSTDVPALAGKYVGGPLICNIDNGQGCTLEGCAWMCLNTDKCDAFAMWDFCSEDDSADAVRPVCRVVDDLVTASGGTATFDRNLRSVCSFHYFDDDENFDWKMESATKARASINYERSTKWDIDCAQYSTSRCGECLDCSALAGQGGADHFLNQGTCQSGNPACKNTKMVLDISTEWNYFRDSDNNNCGLCPKHCIDCDNANDCAGCSSGLFTVNDGGTGCEEIGCTVDLSTAPGNSTGDASGPSSFACVDTDNVEPYAYCDIKCNDGYYQATGTSLTAQCNGAGGDIVWPASTCEPCSEDGCAVCSGNVCSSCEDGYALQNDNTCLVVTCPLAAEVEPACTVCDSDKFGTISWDSSSSSWDVSNCRACSNVLANCATCNGTNAGDALCTSCDSGYVLDENRDCIAQQFCPEGQEGSVVYDTGAGSFDFSDCSTVDDCPRTSETAPACADCPVGYVGGVDWVRTNDTHGYWSTAECELVDCPTEDETSPNCAACPWGFTGTAYWDDASGTWAGCVSNDFGLVAAPASLLRATARSTSPVLEARGVLASFSADGAVVEAVEAAPFELDRESSGYFFKNNGAYNTAEDHWNCEPGFGGADCSLRMCPHGLSYFSSSDEAAVGGSEGLFWTTDIGQKSSATFHGRHVYRECSGRGICDYTLGECQCFESFTGRGCQRRECPNSCSGHGICASDDLNLYHNTHATGAEATLPSGRFSPAAATADPNLWASESQQACVCDGGWTGHDCSLRMCPVGDDPETDCADELAYDVHQINCSALDETVDHYFSVTYTSPLGHVYNTPPVIITAYNASEPATTTATSSSVQQALESLPNFAIPSVEVDTVNTDDGATFTSLMSVTFNDAANTGQQSLLEVTYTERCTSGSLPYFVNTDTGFTCTVERISQSNSLREQAECANRGLCNTRTGECACYDGYEGKACEIVTATI